MANEMNILNTKFISQFILRPDSRIAE